LRCHLTRSSGRYSDTKHRKIWNLIQGYLNPINAILRVLRTAARTRLKVEFAKASAINPEMEEQAP